MPTKANKATNHSCTSDSSHTNELNQKTKNSKKKVGKNLASVLKGIPEEEIKNSNITEAPSSEIWSVFTLTFSVEITLPSIELI